MSDRDDLAKIIHNRMKAYTWDNADDYFKDEARATADLVLDALGDRLLPELPEGWDYSIVCARLYDPGFHASLVKEGDDARNPHDGRGATIADAIRDAMKD